MASAIHLREREGCERTEGLSVLQGGNANAARRGEGEPQWKACAAHGRAEMTESTWGSVERAALESWRAREDQTGLLSAAAVYDQACVVCMDAEADGADLPRVPRVLVSLLRLARTCE